MDDLGNIIYVLLLLVGLFVSGLSKMKAKTKPKKVHEKGSPFGGEWEELRDIFEQAGREEVVESLPIPVQQTQEVTRPPRIESYETVANNADLRVKNRLKTAKKSFEENLRTEDSSDLADEISLSTPEEARRAFVYSEIFARKY